MCGSYVDVRVARPLRHNSAVATYPWGTTSDRIQPLTDRRVLTLPPYLGIYICGPHNSGNRAIATRYLMNRSRTTLHRSHVAQPRRPHTDTFTSYLRLSTRSVATLVRTNSLRELPLCDNALSTGYTQSRYEAVIGKHAVSTRLLMSARTCVEHSMVHMSLQCTRTTG